MLRLRSTLREYFPAALQAFEDLDAPDALELLGKAPDPDQAARLSIPRIIAALKRARRRNIAGRAKELRSVLAAPQVRQPPVLQSAYAAIVASEVAVIAALSLQIDRLGAVVGEHFGRHRDAEIYTNLPAESSKALVGHGTLYKALGRLRTRGLLSAEWENSAAAEAAGRPRRKLYWITAAGATALTEATATPRGFRIGEAPA